MQQLVCGFVVIVALSSRITGSASLRGLGDLLVLIALGVRWIDVLLNLFKACSINRHNSISHYLAHAFCKLIDDVNGILSS